MGQPGIDASGQLLQIQRWKRWAINLLQSEQPFTGPPFFGIQIDYTWATAREAALPT
jgi:hypothetical protein